MQYRFTDDITHSHFASLKLLLSLLHVLKKALEGDLHSISVIDGYHLSPIPPCLPSLAVFHYISHSYHDHPCLSASVALSSLSKPGSRHIHVPRYERCMFRQAPHFRVNCGPLKREAAGAEILDDTGHVARMFASLPVHTRFRPGASFVTAELERLGHFLAHCGIARS